MCIKNCTVNMWEWGICRKLNFKNVEPCDEPGINRISCTSRAPHCTHKLYILNIFPVQILPGKKSHKSLYYQMIQRTWIFQTALCSQSCVFLLTQSYVTFPCLIKLSFVEDLPTTLTVRSNFLLQFNMVFVSWSRPWYLFI